MQIKYLILAVLMLFSFSASAATVTFAVTNSLGQPDSTPIKVYTLVGAAQADGSWQSVGIPFNILLTNGIGSKVLAAGNYKLTNSTLVSPSYVGPANFGTSQGIIIAVPSANGTYPFGLLAIPGYNVYNYNGSAAFSNTNSLGVGAGTNVVIQTNSGSVTVQVPNQAFLTNGLPSRLDVTNIANAAYSNNLAGYVQSTVFNSATNSLASVSLAQIQATNTALKSSSQIGSTVLTNLSATGAQTNQLVGGSGVVLTTNLGIVTITINFGTNGLATTNLVFDATNGMRIATGLMAFQPTNTWATFNYVTSSIATTSNGIVIASGISAAAATNISNGQITNLATLSLNSITTNLIAYGGANSAFFKSGPIRIQQNPNGSVTDVDAWFIQSSAGNNTYAGFYGWPNGTLEIGGGNGGFGGVPFRRPLWLSDSGDVMDAHFWTLLLNVQTNVVIGGTNSAGTNALYVIGSGTIQGDLIASNNIFIQNNLNLSGLRPYQLTTNIVAALSAGVSIVIGTYTNIAGTLYTNTLGNGVDLKFSTPTWFFRTNNEAGGQVNLYSASSVGAGSVWSDVVGVSTPPVTSYGYTNNFIGQVVANFPIAVSGGGSAGPVPTNTVAAGNGIDVATNITSGNSVYTISAESQTNNFTSIVTSNANTFTTTNFVYANFYPSNNPSQFGTLAQATNYVAINYYPSNNPSQFTTIALATNGIANTNFVITSGLAVSNGATRVFFFTANPSNSVTVTSPAIGFNTNGMVWINRSGNSNNWLVLITTNR